MIIFFKQQVPGGGLPFGEIKRSQIIPKIFSASLKHLDLIHDRSVSSFESLEKKVRIYILNYDDILCNQDFCLFIRVRYQEPARLIIRLLIGFVSNLSDSTKTQQQILRRKCYLELGNLSRDILGSTDCFFSHSLLKTSCICGLSQTI